MASLLQPLSTLSSSPTLAFHRNSIHVHSHFSCKKLSKSKTLKNKSLTISFALAESDSPKFTDQETQPLLQELADSFVLPPDYFAQLPNDLRLDLNDAAFDLSNGPVIDECGQEMGEALLNLSRAWEKADTSTSSSIASKLPALTRSLTGNAKSAFGKRLISSGRRFASMGQYGQGELQRISKTMVEAGKQLAASPVTTPTNEKPETESKVLKFGTLQVELTSDKANIGAAIALGFGILCWQLSQGIQNIPESSLEYANDNALTLAKEDIVCNRKIGEHKHCLETLLAQLQDDEKIASRNKAQGFPNIIQNTRSLRIALLAVCYSSAVLSACSTVGLFLLARQLKSKDDQ